MAERASSGLSPRRISPRKGTGAVSPATGTSPAAVGTSPAAAKTSPAAAKTSPAAAASTTPPAAAAGTSLSAAGTSPAASGTSPAAASTSPQLGADRERKRKREGSPGVRGSGSPAGVGGPAATMELVEVPPAPMSRELLLSEEPSEPPAPHFSLSPFGLDRLRSDIRNACSEVVDQLGPTAHSPVPGLEDVSLADAASEEGKAHRLHVLRVVRECAVSKPLVALATVRAANLAWPADATFSVGPSSSALVEAVVHAATIWPECAVGDEVPPFEPNHQEGVLLSTGGRAKEGGRKKRRVSFGTVNERLFDMNSPTRRRLDPFESASDYSKWSQWPFRLEELSDEDARFEAECRNMACRCNEDISIIHDALYDCWYKAVIKVLLDFGFALPSINAPVDDSTCNGALRVMAAVEQPSTFNVMAKSPASKHAGAGSAAARSPGGSKCNKPSHTLHSQMGDRVVLSRSFLTRKLTTLAQVQRTSQLVMADYPDPSLMISETLCSELRRFTISPNGAADHSARVALLESAYLGEMLKWDDGQKGKSDGYSHGRRRLDMEYYSQTFSDRDIRQIIFDRFGYEGSLPRNKADKAAILSSVLQHHTNNSIRQAQVEVLLAHASTDGCPVGDGVVCRAMVSPPVCAPLPIEGDAMAKACEDLQATIKSKPAVGSSKGRKPMKGWVPSPAVKSTATIASVIATLKKEAPVVQWPADIAELWQTMESKCFQSVDVAHNEGVGTPPKT